METVCQINFNYLKWREEIIAERILREYLLSSCDKISMVLSGASSVSLFTSSRIHPNRLRKFLKDEDIAERMDNFWTFNATENVKKLLNQSNLFFTGRDVFHGFADPKFLKTGKTIGLMLTGEKILTLHITDDDKKELSEKGVYMDSPEM
jgi:hypothetical protein